MRNAMRGAAAGQLMAQRGVASLEFALVAPILLALTLFGIDCARAFLIWREIHNAALAIADNAGKLSVTYITDPTTGKVTATSELTYDQMQQAMSTIYAEIPALNLGNGTGLFPDNFAVTLSSIEFYPLCAAANTTSCGTQKPRVLWSTSLERSGVAPAPKLIENVYRSCGIGVLTPKPAFADDASQYITMIDPAMAQIQGADTTLTVPPQIVADVQYHFVPWAPFFFRPSTFYASAAVPAPVGGLDQTTSVNGAIGAGNTCPYPTQ
jgi:Flp pilus assembly protein TadG